MLWGRPTLTTHRLTTGLAGNYPADHWGPATSSDSFSGVFSAISSGFLSFFGLLSHWKVGGVSGSLPQAVTPILSKFGPSFGTFLVVSYFYFYIFPVQSLL